MLKRLLLGLVGLAMVGLGVSAGAMYYAWSWLHKSVEIAEDSRYQTLAAGESLHSLGARLHDQGLLRWPQLWRAYARCCAPESIKQGEYRLSAEESPVTMLARFQRGEVIRYNVTLVEGRTFADWLATLAAQPKLTAHLQGLSRDEQMQLLGVDVAHPEGWFFPDTYQFIAGDSDLMILRRAHDRMRWVLDLHWQNRALGLPYESPYEALIMASIIERETGVVYERPKIAGVFVRRLQKGMRLQTDPTVIYGMGEAYQGRITRRDLREHTPYNTYRIRGLPPTPIAMPSEHAIASALNPAEGTALYFVARGDGTHQFSDTLEEHNRAVARYQLQRSESYRSSPPPRAAQP